MSLTQTNPKAQPRPGQRPNWRPSRRTLAAWLFLLGWLMAGCAAPQPASPAAISATPALVIETVSERALAWLQDQELDSGGFADSRGQFSPNNTSTVLAVLSGLPAQEISAFRLQSALTALAPTVEGWLAAQDSGALAKAILGVASAGGDPRNVAGLDLVADLWTFYDADTALFHPESLFRHLLSIQALIAAGETVPDPALAVIGQIQQADGSWSWRITENTGETGANVSGDVDTTAQTLLTLAVAGVDREDSRVQAALTFLAQTQSADGGWAMDAESVANANSTGLVLSALGRLGFTDAPPPGIRTVQAQSWLATLQQPDGSFHYSEELPGAIFLATLDALPAFQWQFAQ